MNLKRWIYTEITGALVLAVLAGVGLTAGLGAQPALAQGGGTPPYLGIRFENSADGAHIVEVVANSPAEAAGLQPGDVITAVNGDALTQDHSLLDVIDTLSADDTITLSVTRGSETLELEATLGVRPEGFGTETPAAPMDNGQAGGMTGSGTETRMQYFSFGGASFARLADGWRVDSVEAGSAAADAGLAVGDIVTTFNDTPTSDVQLGTLIQLGGEGGDAALTVERGSETLDLTLTLAAGSPVESHESVEMMPEATPMAPEATPESAPPVPAPAIPQGMPDDGRGFLGVSFITLTPEIIANLTADDATPPVDEGGLIMRVEAGTPAEDAGLQVDDVITAVNGEPVDQERTLADRIYAYEAGDTITLDVARGSETLSLDVTLAARANELNMDSAQHPGASPVRGSLPKIRPTMDRASGRISVRTVAATTTGEATMAVTATVVTAMVVATMVRASTAGASTA